jgi:Recombination endonuclease VII
MTKYKPCRITNCKNKVTDNGNVCGTHRWRKRKYNSYDLPNHVGEPNFYKPLPELPEGIVRDCKKHGLLKIEETYSVKYKQNTHYKCKKCILSLNLKKKYSHINSIEEYEVILKSQQNSCGICNGPNNTTRSGNIKRFNIDHCHKSGKVRGLLCTFCNSLLGYSKDSIEILQSAIRYLEKHK